MASSCVWAMITPFPAASPSALITMGKRLLADIIPCGFNGIKRPEGGRGDLVSFEKCLGKSLGSLQLGRIARGAEALHARILEDVRDAGHQRGLRPDDRQPHFFLPREIQKPFDIGR